MLQKSQELVEEIVEDINKLSGKHGSTEIFSDWVTMMGLEIQNACYLYQFQTKKWEYKERENEYKAIVEKYKKVKNKYNEKELKIITEMCDDFKTALEVDMWDYLGEIFMRLSNSPDKKKMGQCFTPFNISILMAKINLANVKEKEIFSLYEPSCGAGGMIIASARVLFEKGINYQKRMVVIAQDLSLLCAYMTYVQLSLLGINAVVVQGDTLEESISNISEDRKFRTLCLRMI